MAWGAPATLGRPRPPRVVAIRRQPLSGGAAPTSTTASPNPTTPSASPWTPPPIPTGAYNPIRDIELGAGKRGLSNTLGDLGTKEERSQDNFLIGSDEVGRQRAQQTDERDKALAKLSESFKRLGTRQGESAASAGLLSGGALLQAAAKRAANEGKGRESVQQSYALQQQADDRAQGRLGLTRQQEGQDNTTQGTRAEREQEQFGIDTRTLEAREAAENGYDSPQAPVAPAGGVVPHTSVQPGAGFVRVGPPKRRR